MPTIAHMSGFLHGPTIRQSLFPALCPSSARRCSRSISIFQLQSKRLYHLDSTVRNNSWHFLNCFYYNVFSTYPETALGSIPSENLRLSLWKRVSCVAGGASLKINLQINLSYFWNNYKNIYTILPVLWAGILKFV